MRRNLITAGFAAALVGMGVAGAHRDTQTQSKCSWVSEPVPDAVIHIQETSPIGIVSAELAWKGKVIRSLLMGQPNGYGSQWSFKGQDGQPVGGGVLCRSEAMNQAEAGDATQGNEATQHPKRHCWWAWGLRSTTAIFVRRGSSAGQARGSGNYLTTASFQVVRRRNLLFLELIWPLFLILRM